MPLPIPRAPPVTIATLPVSDMFVGLAVIHDATQTRLRVLDIQYPSSIIDDTSHSYISACGEA